MLGNEEQGGYNIQITYTGGMEGNPFFIGQVKILTIHLKREFNKPVEVSAPKSRIVGQSAGSGHGVASASAVGGGVDTWRRVNALFGRPIGVDCARRPRTRVCVVQHNGGLSLYI